jgi:hypothetical protein
MKKLVEILELEDKHFRRNTVIFWDGASYHSADETIKTMRALDIPIMQLAPYSYLSAPCELAFGLFKSVNINKLEMPMGKR